MVTQELAHMANEGDIACQQTWQEQWCEAAGAGCAEHHYESMRDNKQ
jgi:hypothetical protein